jgi:hypothetical protein
MLFHRFFEMVWSFPGANIIKHFTIVIYCHSMSVLSLCVIKLFYLINFCGPKMAVKFRRMAVNYYDILSQEKVGLKLLW